MKNEQISNKFYKNLGVKGLAKQVSSRRKKDIEYIKKFCEKSDKILDLACGYGRITIPMAKAGYNISGIDLAPNYIREAKINAKKQKLKIRFDIGSMLNLPYSDESFDKVICMWSSFSHLLTKKDQVETINEIYRILKPKGIALIEMVNGEKKKLRTKVEKEGMGENKRVWGETFNGVKSTTYIHTRKTLSLICKDSKFKNYKVGFARIMKGQRLTIKLYKK